MLYLTDREVAQILSPSLAAEAIEGAFRHLAAGDAASQARVRTVTRVGKLSTVGAVLTADGLAGAKVYPTTTGGRFGFMVLLFEMGSGQALAVMAGAALTEIRTAATSVVAARYLARKEARILTIFGAGRQAGAHARAFAEEFSLNEIRVVHRRDAAGFVGEVASHTGVRAYQATVTDALPGCDLIVTATRASSSLFSGLDVPDGCHITALGATLPTTRELDSLTVDRADPVVVESIDQARMEAGDLLLAADDGVAVWDRVIELAELVSGARIGRRDSHQITLYKSLGVGLEDVAAAAAVYRGALRNSVGLRLDEGG
ncbi:MAG: ornithine cyclodeaminase family protein [Actinomycetota bacterium]